MTERKTFKTAAFMKELMAKYYREGKEAREKGIPVVWISLPPG